jgi:aarF domain-containing kinase
MKIQYTGVGDSIDSDLNNFKRLITCKSFLLKSPIVFGAPRGLYLNELIETTRLELYWETDYLREAEYQRNYGEKLTPYPEEYYCPKVVNDLTTKHVLCTEFIDGVEVDTLINES